MMVGTKEEIFLIFFDFFIKKLQANLVFGLKGCLGRLCETSELARYGGYPSLGRRLAVQRSGNLQYTIAINTEEQ
jgi:hypothetical protein